MVYATNELEGAAALYVAAARDRALTWAQIGAALGVSRQAARQRYAGAVRRRRALSENDVRHGARDTGWLQVSPVRGVWEGGTVRMVRPRGESGEQ